MNDLAKFQIEATAHTADGERVLDSPQAVRDMIGDAFDLSGLNEEIDYTLEVKRVHIEKCTCVKFKGICAKEKCDCWHHRVAAPTQPKSAPLVSVLDQPGTPSRAMLIGKIENASDVICACGHFILSSPYPETQTVHSWYWQKHSVSGCSLEIPDVVCWCGMKRSEHIDGHKEGVQCPTTKKALEAWNKRAAPSVQQGPSEEEITNRLYYTQKDGCPQFPKHEGTGKICYGCVEQGIREAVAESSGRVRELEQWKREATEALSRWDGVTAFLRTNFDVREWGGTWQDAVLGRLAKLRLVRGALEALCECPDTLYFPGDSEPRDSSCSLPEELHALLGQIEGGGK